MKYIKRIRFNILTPFKTISVNDAPNLKRIFDSVELHESLFSNLTKLLKDYPVLTDKQILDTSKLITSVVSTTDETIIEIDFRRLFADSISFTDGITAKNTGLGKSDSIALPDTLDRTVQFKRNLYDTVSFIHNIGKATGKKLPDDSLSVTDQFSKSVAYFRAKDDSFLVSEQITTKSVGKGLNEIVNCIDSLGRVVVFNRRYDDVFSFSEVVNKTTTKLFRDYIYLTDNISIATADGEYEFLSIGDKALLTTGKFIQESFNVSEQISTKSLNKLTNDYVVPSDEFIKIVNFLRTIQETVSVTDQISKDFIPPVKQEFIGIGDGDLDLDIIAGGLEYHQYLKTIFESYSLIDSVAFITQKLFGETISATDSGGQIIINNYMDSQYISENYIGTIKTF
jgi:hypothetical protein